jgi:ribosomal protein L40E
VEESLINKHKVCKSCDAISGPRITRCPKCQSEDFRPLTKEEVNGLPRMVYELRGRPLVPPSTYDKEEIITPVTNVFVL